jgi:hypothetical protein
MYLRPVRFPECTATFPRATENNHYMKKSIY